MTTTRRIALLFLLACASFACAQQPVNNGQPPISAAGLTSTTCPGSGCSSVATTGYGVATVTVHGTYAGATIAFQFSDDGGTTYYSEQCERTDIALQETGETLPSNQTRSWDCGVYATSNFQVVLTAISSGTATVGITLSAASIEPAPTVTVSGQVPVEGYSSQNTSDAAWTSATSLNTRVTQISNLGIYNSILVTLVQGSTITGGVITLQQSNDNSNWVGVQCVTIGTTTIMGPTYTLVASTNVMFLCPVSAPYFGVQLTTAITGSATVTVGHNALSLPSVGLLAGSAAVTQSGTWNVGVNNWGGVGLGTPTNFGTTPGAVVAASVNASLFIGTTIVSSSNPFPISATGAANTKTNPLFAAPTDGANVITAAISAVGVLPTGTEVMTVNNVAMPETVAGVATSAASLTASITTTGTNVKGSAGNLYGVFAINGIASVCWVQFVNSATGGTLGTASIVSFPLPASTTQPIWIPLAYPINFTTGIAVGVSTTAGGSTACGTTGASLTVVYK